MEPTTRPIPFDDFESSKEVITGTNQGAIVKVPCVQIQAGDFGFYAFDDGVECEGTQWP